MAWNKNIKLLSLPWLFSILKLSKKTRNAMYVENANRGFFERYLDIKV